MLPTLVALIVGGLYAALQAWYILHWRNLSARTGPPLSPASEPGVTVLVIARNEAAGIEACLASLVTQDYPRELVEIIVVDDHSSDDTPRIAGRYPDDRIKVLALADHPAYINLPGTKKSAITLGVDEASHDLILMTDADSVVGPGWIAAHVKTHRMTDSQFQTGPVLIDKPTGSIGYMQAIEYHALMVVTGGGLQAGSHCLANGANMAFSRHAFRAVGGYNGNFEYASGDDLFLAEKMLAAFPTGLAYVKASEAIVRTEAASSWKALFAQRQRWAGKNRALRDPWIERVWLFIGAVHLLSGLLLMASLFGVLSFLPLAILLALKWGVDAWMLSVGTSFSGDRNLWARFWESQLLYSGYVLALGVKLFVPGPK